MRSEADVVQACIDVYGDRTDRAEDLVERSLERSRSYRPWVVAVAANIQSFCDIHAMRFHDARDRQRWAVPFHERTIGPFAGVYGRCFAGIAALAQLDVAAAEDHLDGAVVLARESAGRRSHAAQLAGALLGELHYERGEVGRGRTAARREPGARGRERRRRLHDRELRAVRAHQGPGRGATDESAELLVGGRHGSPTGWA